MAKTFKQLLNTDLIPEMSDIGSTGTSAWKLVNKVSGDTLEVNSINVLTMTGNATLKLPAVSTNNRADAFALTVNIVTKGTITFLNNDGTPLSSFVYGPAFDDTGSVEVGDPLTAFDTLTAGSIAQFYFEENADAYFKISIRKLEIGNGTVVVHTVTFASNGGSSVPSQPVVHGATASVPTNPTYAGHDFVNWYSDEALTNVYNFSTPVTSDITLYARWIISDQVTVTFLNGGAVYNTQTIPRNSTVSTPTAPTKDKYTFNGWFTSETGGTLVDLTQPIAENKVFYAQYSITNPVTVTFYNEDESVYMTKTIPSGTVVGDVSSPSKTGYTFSGWYYKVAGEYTTEFNPRSDIITENTAVYSKFISDTMTDWTKFPDGLPDLEVGDELVAPPAYGFDSIIFEVVDTNKNQTESHVPVSGYTKTVTLQTKYLLSKTDKSVYPSQFDASSSNLWKNSDIRTWLNDTSTTKGKYGAFLGSFLLDETGVAKTGVDLAIANAFLNVLKTPSIETYTGSGTKETTTDKVWLPSVYQVGAGTSSSSWGQEGAVLDKYSEAPGIGGWGVRIKKDTAGTESWWWLRSASSSDSTDVWLVISGGHVYYYDSVYSNHGVSPLITLAYNTCAVTYKYNDGTTPDTVQTRVVGGHAVKINPVRSGYYFDAWYTDEALTSKFDFTNTTLTGDLTLYAKWKGVDWTNLPEKLSSMNVGDLIEAPSAYGFDRIILEMVDRDKVDVADATGSLGTDYHTVTLQTLCLLTKTDKSVYQRTWDDSSNDWETSDIRVWLNGDFLNAFLKNADGTDKTGDDLVQSQAFINAIQSAIIKTKPYNGADTSYKTTNDKVWLLSAYQVNASASYTNEGPVLDKYGTFTMTISNQTERVKKTTGTDGKGTGGTRYSWWLRSAYPSSSAYVWCVYDYGNVSYYNNVLSYGVSPLMTFKY